MKKSRAQLLAPWKVGNAVMLFYQWREVLSNASTLRYKESSLCAAFIWISLCCCFDVNVPFLCVMFFLHFSSPWYVLLREKVSLQWMNELKSDWNHNGLVWSVMKALSHNYTRALELSETVTAACLIGWLKLGKCRFVHRWSNNDVNVPLNPHIVPA